MLVLTTALIAAFIPGESPPDVRTPILVTFDDIYAIKVNALIKTRSHVFLAQWSKIRVFAQCGSFIWLCNQQDLFLVLCSFWQRTVMKR
jgi:hypothetical protein